MFFFGRKWRLVKWIALIIIGLFVLGNLYALFLKPGNNSVVTVLIIGLALGAALMFFIARGARISNATTVRESTHTIVESMKKVFKVVCAEGLFNELYDYEETKNYLGFIPSTKKALVVIRAKVLVGFDFEKCIWEADDEKKRISLVSFPHPEILSVEADYQYYNMENGLFNKFDKNDLGQIQERGKKQIELAAFKSDLPQLAGGQIKTILTEVLLSNGWQLENADKIALRIHSKTE